MSIGRDIDFQKLHYDPLLAGIRREDQPTMATEIFMCKLEFHIDELNWDAYNNHGFYVIDEFVESADENMKVLEYLKTAEEALHLLF